jgi:hypothetical protein
MANARPFSGMNKPDALNFGGGRDPFLLCKDIVRDMSLPEGKNMVSWNPATYVVRIDGCEYSGTRKKGDKFKCKLFVMAGNGPTKGKAVYMIMASSDYFDRDVAQLVCNIMNAPPVPFTNSKGESFPGFSESDYEIIVSKAQPLVGRYVCVEVQNQKNDGSKDASKKGNDFTQHRWSPIMPITDATGAIIDWAPPVINNVKEWADLQAAQSR